MTPEERQMLAGLFERIRAAGGAPRDAEAEAFLNDAVRATPYAPYVLAQTALVQQHALEAAAQRIAQLEAAQRAAEQQHGQEQGSFLGNLGRSIFGGPASPPPARPAYDQAPPQAPQGQAYAPPPPPGYASPRPGPWGAPQAAPTPPQGGGGGGFLQNAASTAAGVAGGVVLGNMLGGLFGGHSGGGLFGGSANASLLGGGQQPGGNETVNIFESAPERGAGGRDEYARDDRGDQGQFDPNMPDDAGFLDDSSFDDGSGGGGYDDV